MDQTTKSSGRIKAIIVLCATAGMIVFNTLAATGRLNGVSTAAISDKYPTMLTPAGYTFSIWSLIYVGLIAFSVYQLLPSKLERLRGVRSLYTFSCVLNCAWLFAWHYELIAVCLVLILALWATLGWILLKMPLIDKAREALFTKAPLGLYFGWITVASLVNLAVLITSAGIQLSTLNQKILACLAITFAVVFAFLVRIKLRNFLFPFAVAWALTGIAVEQKGSTSIILAAALGVIVCLVLSISFVMDLPSIRNDEPEDLRSRL